MTYYAVIFDNDTENPGTHFVNVADNLDNDEDIPNENITENLDCCNKIISYQKKFYSHLNYRVVEVIIKELEPT